jgi:hypothetical protein
MDATVFRQIRKAEGAGVSATRLRSGPKDFTGRAGERAADILALRDPKQN